MSGSLLIASVWLSGFLLGAPVWVSIYRWALRRAGLVIAEKDLLGQAGALLAKRAAAEPVTRPLIYDAVAPAEAIVALQRTITDAEADGQVTDEERAKMKAGLVRAYAALDVLNPRISP